MAFAGARVLAFESRRTVEMAELIRRNGGDPFVAPSLVETPLERNEEAFRFAEELFAGRYDMVVLLTGVGTRFLTRVLATRYPVEQFAAALRCVTVVARGPKPTAVLREMGVAVNVPVPEPNTWRELLVAVAPHAGERVAVQEYGRPNPELIAGLEAQGRAVSTVRVYQWELPADTGPLRRAIAGLAEGEFPVALFTTSVQVDHLLQVAAQEGREEAVRAGLQRTLIASIGPDTSAALREAGLTPGFEPTHPKMGIMVGELAAGWEQRGY